MSLARIEKLLEIMAALRNPQTGCPWDLEQSFRSIVPYTLEEAYEVAEAIEQDDMDGLKSELGDLLFQIVFYARLAQEQKMFDFADIVDGINEKMIRRHPHVFGGLKKALSQEEIAGQWERIKDAENDRDNLNNDPGQQKPPSSVLDGVPLSLPALSRAVKLQNRAARVGFDWPSLGPVFDKMREELAELEHEINSGGDMDHITEEYADVLFVMANVGRHLKLDPEQALRAANSKFIRRFSVIEELLAAKGRSLEDADLEEMEKLWNVAKQRERQS